MVICRSTAGQLQLNYRSTIGQLQVIYRSTAGQLQVIYRSSTGHLQVIYRSSTGHLQVIYRSTTGQLQVNYRSSTGQLQVNCRSSRTYALEWFSQINDNGQPVLPFVSPDPDTAIACRRHKPQTVVTVLYRVYCALREMGK